MLGTARSKPPQTRGVMCRIYNMKRIVLRVTFLIVVFELLIGCAYFDKPYKPLSISDIQGTWEGYTYSYFLLDVNENGKGYLVVTLSKEIDKIFEIQEISFSPRYVHLTFKNIHEENDFLKLDGLFYTKEELIIPEIEYGGKKDLVYLRFKKVDPSELREEVKQKINGIKLLSHNHSAQKDRQV